MCHPEKCQFQTTILAVPNVERVEPSHFIRLPSNPLSLPGTPLHRDARPIPLENIISVSVLLPAVPARWPSSLPLSPRRMAGASAHPLF